MSVYDEYDVEKVMIFYKKILEYKRSNETAISELAKYVKDRIHKGNHPQDNMDVIWECVEMCEAIENLVNVNKKAPEILGLSISDAKKKSTSEDGFQ